jgi:hypothetical protein
MTEMIPNPRDGALGATIPPAGDVRAADRIAGFTAVGATLRAVTDAVSRTARALSGEPVPATRGHELAALVDDVRGQLPVDGSEDLDSLLTIAATSSTRLAELGRRTSRGGPGSYAPLTQLGVTVADAYHLAVEAWIAAGPDGTREAVLPPVLLDLPSELVRATAELDELAAGGGRTRARELLAATDLLLGLGRDVGALVDHLA